MKVRSHIAEAIAAEGVDTVFGLLGEANLRIVHELVERFGVRFVAARHEHAAVAMADGYARAGASAALCSVTRGPGLAQTASALTTAAHARSPVVMLAGDTAATGRHQALSTDQRGFALATAGAIRDVRSAGTATEDVRSAFRHVRTGAGPIVLNVPTDVQEAEAPPESPDRPSTADLPGPGVVDPCPEAVGRALAAIEGAHRPVILAGRGAVRSGARAELVALSHRLGAPLCTSLLAQSWFADEPHNIGLCGGFAAEETRAVLMDSDLVLCFGASLNRFTTHHGALVPARSLVRVDDDPTVHGDRTPSSVPVLGDCRRTARALLDGLDEGARNPWTPRTAPGCLDGDGPFPDTAKGLDPRQVALSAERLLPTDRNLVVGVGHYSGWAVRRISVPHPDRLVLPWDFGAVGMGLPTAIGVATARPEPLTVLVEGDGGIMMTLGELDTLRRSGNRIVALIFDDRAYGAELHVLNASGDDAAITTFDGPPIAATARGMGLGASEVYDTAELECALAEAARASGPVVIVARVNPTVADHYTFEALHAPAPAL